MTIFPASTDKKLKYGLMLIEENSFRIPYTYAFQMKLGDNIQMILGCNFIRAMQGGDYIASQFDRKGKGILIEEEAFITEERQAHFLSSDTTQKILSAESLGPQKKTKNMLYNLVIELRIPKVTPFKVRAILDTGATTCCIDINSVPSDAIEPNLYLVH